MCKYFTINKRRKTKVLIFSFKKQICHYREVGVGYMLDWSNLHFLALAGQNILVSLWIVSLVSVAKDERGSSRDVWNLAYLAS